MKLWSSLRRAAAEPAPAVTVADPAAGREEKVLLSDYYAGLTALGIDPTDRSRDWSVDRAVSDAYERVVWVHKAVEAISSNAARLPFRLRDGEEVIDDHPLYRVLNKRANPLETGRMFRKRLSAQVLLSKRGAFVEVTLSRAGTPVRMDLLPPGRTLPVPGTGADLVSHFEVRSVDGYKTRDVPVEKVRWVREPHPLDPYSGVTPLEAAGLSVELDHHSRLYNVRFMRNDGRPGVLIAVKGDADEAVLKAIEQKVDRGPGGAGRTTAITADGLETIDMAARPRDMQYQQTSRNAKAEILVAFGTPESVLGNASERTFANADAELYAFWTITMPGHLDMVVSAFDQDSGEQLEGFLDTSTVEALQRAQLAKREEARAEVAAGLRSIWSYAELAGLSDEIESTFKTRSLWVPAGRNPIPATDEDEQTASESPTAGQDPQTDQLIAQLLADTGADAAAEGDAAAGADSAAEGDTGGGGGGDAAPAAAAKPAALEPPAKKAAPVVNIYPSPLAAEDAARAVAARMRLVIERKADDQLEHIPAPEARDQLEADVTAALQELVVRWIERTTYKLGGQKARKGTRHWEPQPGYEVDTRVGIKALDPAVAIDPERWSAEAQEAVEPIVLAAAATAAAALISDLAPDGDDGDGSTLAAAAANLTTTAVIAAVGKWASAQAMSLIGLANGLDQDGLDMTAIIGAVRQQTGRLESWAEGVATQVATVTGEQARAEAAGQLAATRGTAAVSRQWFTRRDDKVRPDHRKADGQTRPIGVPFEVGGSLLRYPGDLAAPAAQTANCRCFLRWRSARGTFTPAPAETKDAGWQEGVHPRDADGKFISKGALISLNGAIIGRAVGTGPDDTTVVVEADNGNQLPVPSRFVVAVDPADVPAAPADAGPVAPVAAGGVPGGSPAAAVDPKHSYVAAGPLTDGALDWRAVNEAATAAPPRVR